MTIHDIVKELGKEFEKYTGAGFESNESTGGAIDGINFKLSGYGDFFHIHREEGKIQSIELNLDFETVYDEDIEIRKAGNILIIDNDKVVLLVQRADSE